MSGFPVTASMVSRDTVGAVVFPARFRSRSSAASRSSEEKTAEAEGRKRDVPSARWKSAGLVASSGGVHDHARDRRAIQGGGEPQPHELPVRFGVQIPARPCRPLLTHHARDRPADLHDCIEGYVVGPQGCGRNVAAGEGRCPGGCILAKQLRGAIPPLGGQIGERADVLVGPSRQGGLGAQLQHGARAGLAPMASHVGVDDPLLLLLDELRAGREPADQVLGDAGDLPGGVAVSTPLTLLPA